MRKKGLRLVYLRVINNKLKVSNKLKLKLKLKTKLNPNKRPDPEPLCSTPSTL